MYSILCWHWSNCQKCTQKHLQVGPLGYMLLHIYSFPFFPFSKLIFLGTGKNIQISWEMTGRNVETSCQYVRYSQCYKQCTSTAVEFLYKLLNFHLFCNLLIFIAQLANPLTINLSHNAWSCLLSSPTSTVLQYCRHQGYEHQWQDDW